MPFAVGRRWPAIAIPLCYAALFAALALANAARYGVGVMDLRPIIPTLVTLSLCGALMSVAVRRLRREPSPLRAVVRDAPTAVALELATVVLMAAFMAHKVVMPRMVPFYLDGLLVEADWWLHFGHHPWQLLPLWPPLTRVLDEVYYSWFTLYFLSIAAWAWLLRGRERARVFLAFFLVWSVLGNLFATLTSSAGPVYAERLGVTDIYVPLTDYLRAQDTQATVRAEVLWYGYTTHIQARGISAMPSLHVALPALVALTAWRVTWLRIALLVLCGLMFLATVHLGWHYAVDGYVAVAGVWLLWRLAHWIIPEHSPSDQGQAPAHRRARGGRSRPTRAR